MTSSRPRLFQFIPLLALVCITALLFSIFGAPLSLSAQEVTQEPEASPTQDPALLVTPEPEVTAEPEAPVEPTSEVAPEVTTEAPLEPVQPEIAPAPVESPFSETFDGAVEERWQFVGWQVAVEAENSFLTAVGANASASPLNLSWPNLSVTARMRISAGNTASLTIRADGDGYRILMDTHGNARLYRGAELVMASPVAEDAPALAEPTWHIVTVQAAGGTILVTIDGIEKIAYSDAQPLSGGAVVFSSGEANTEAVALDDVLIVQFDDSVVLTPAAPEAPATTEAPVEVVEEPVAPVEPEITLEPTVEEPIEPEITPEPAVEAVAPVEPEITPEPEVNVTAETTPDDPSDDVVIFAADFEGELVGWAASPGASVVSVDAENKALLLPDTNSLRAAQEAAADTYRFDGQFRLLNLTENNTNSGLVISIGTAEALYELSFGETNVVLASGGAVLAEGAAALSTDIWHRFSLNITENTLTAALDDVIVVSYPVDQGAAANLFGLSANGAAFMLDNLSVVDTSSELVEAPATLAPMTITPENEGKLIDALNGILKAYEAGDIANAERALAELEVPIDEAGRVEIVIWANNGKTGADIAALVESVGGADLHISKWSVTAFVSFDGILALINNQDVSGVQFQPKASSTGPSGKPADAPTGTKATEGFNMLGIEAWHSRPGGAVLGAGVNVAIIDRGFVGYSDAGDQACLTNGQGPRPGPGSGTGNHGLNMIEVICDVSPSASVFMYTASDYLSLAEAVTNARLDGMKVIVIALELGANETPGDGTLGFTEPNPDDNPYIAIKKARDAGIVVIASAGNNNGRYTAFNYSGGATTVSIHLRPGESVNVGWSQWDKFDSFGPAGTSYPAMSLTGAGLSLTYSATTGKPGHQFSSTSGCTPTVGPGNALCNVTLTISGYNSSAGGTANVIQVQVTSTQTGTASSIQSVSSGLLTTIGSLARPADSSDVISVGAVCFSHSENYPILDGSSNGPRYGSNGTEYLGSDIKPDLVSASSVSTVISGDSQVEGGCNTTQPGFTGTSAAAAHVAGMTALLISNTVNNPSLAEFTLNKKEAVNAIKRYLQTHSVEMPFGSGADGFDLIHGAGLSILGSPDYDWSLAINPIDEADGVDIDGNGATDCTGDFVYVGQGSAYDVPTGNPPAQDGTLANPFFSAAFALTQVNTGAFGNCVIVLPGEYVTPLAIEGVDDGTVLASYLSASGAQVGDSIFSTITSYHTADGGGAIYFDNGVDGVSVHGFKFVAGMVYKNPSGYAFPGPTGVTFDDSDNSVISSSSFTGWNFTDATIINVLPNTSSAQIKGNTFKDNISLADLPVLINVNLAGTLGGRIEINRNIFDNNTGGSLPGGDWVGLILTSDSHTDIVNNVFYANDAETVIQARTNASTDTYETRILGNIFMDNIIRKIDLEPANPSNFVNTPGPLINLYFNRNFYFINNTVVGTSMAESGSFSALIGRGDNILGNGLSDNNGSLDSAGTNFAAWEIHNNLIYNNSLGSSGVLVKDMDNIVGGALCRNIGDPTAPPTNNDDTGATFNWIFGNLWASGNQGFGSCDYVITNVTRSNDTTTDPNGFFVGNDPENTLVNPWDFYAPAFNSPAVDSGNSSAAGGGIIGVAPFDKDIVGQTRTADGNIDLVTVVDKGAFEFVPIKINFTVLIPEPYYDAGIFQEDGGAGGNIPFSIDLGAPVVEGGFGTLTYTINDDAAGSFEFPNNFGTHCGPQFTGTRGVVIVGDTVLYCPPRNFYTDDTGTDPTNRVPDFVRFTFKVQDSTGANAVGQVRFEITPENDQPIIATSNIGDGLDAAGAPSPNDIFETSINIDNSLTQATIQLRPFVKFNNFSFSETNNPEFANRVDYLFTYPAHTATPDGPGIITGSSLNPDTGVLTIDLGGSTGDVEVIYTVTDRTGGTSTTNKLVVHVISRIPDRGLHDDTSFALAYDNGNDANPGPGQWKALYSEGNINNSLHETRSPGDRVQFSFIGKGFVIYMQGAFGGLWELKIDGQSLPNWTPAVTPNIVATINTFDVGGANVQCTTRGPVNGNRISNFTLDAYTVTCNGMNDMRHDISIANLEAKPLRIDAISIIRDGSDLMQPGMYDVDVVPLRDVLAAAGWTEVNDLLASKKLARSTTANSPVSFDFTNATGVALGTVAEPKGASYDLCVVGIDPVSPKVCQRYDNNLSALTKQYNVFRPLYGLNPENEYRVSIEDITVPAGGRMLVDSLVILNEAPGGRAELGTTEDDAVAPFVFANGLDDSWTLNRLFPLASNSSLTSLAVTLPGVGVLPKNGPFASFHIPGGADVVYWKRNGSAIDSQNLMICVDRALGVGADPNNHGNCLLVNLRANNATVPPVVKYSRVEADGSLTAVTDIIQPTSGLIEIAESMFRGGTWGAGDPVTGNHTIEIFSLVNETWNFDRVTVVDSAGFLMAGEYEEFVDSIQYFKAADLNTPVVPLYNDFTTDPDGFTQFVGPLTVRASGGGLMQTKGLGNVIFFRFEGVGFAPHFKLERNADAVNICYLSDPAGTVTPTDVLTTGVCQTFDNESLAIIENAGRGLFTIKRGRYAVAIEMLPDNFLPAGHNPTFGALTLSFDSVIIYDNDQTALNDLTPGTRYEGSFNNRLIDNHFAYFGSAWKSFSGAVAIQRSNSDYDSTLGKVGAGVFFFTNGADAITFYRDLSAIYSPVLVCAALDTGGGTFDTPKCTIVSNKGTGFQKPVTIYLNDDPFAAGTPGRYAVSMSTLTTGTFVFDAVEPINVVPLGPGLYDDTAQGIVYGADFASLVVNGDMDIDGLWTGVASTRSSAQRYNGTYSRHVAAANNGETLNSSPMDLVNGETYTVIGRVFVVSGQVSMHFDTVAEFGTAPTTAGITGKWLTLRRDFTATSNHNDVLLQFEAIGASQFYVDDVSVVTGAEWENVLYGTAFGGSFNRSLTHGASVEFQVQNATGFEIGTMLDLIAGEVEICYGTLTEWGVNAPHCAVFENESSVINVNTSRTFGGLNPAETYRVVVRDVEDGYTTRLATTPTTPRLSLYRIGRFVLDFVRVWNDAEPSVVGAGSYNENALVNGVQALQLLPTSSWGKVSGPAATLFTEQSYATVVSNLGVASRLHAGPFGLINLDTNGTGEAASVVLNVGRVSTASSSQFLACVDHIEGKIMWDGAKFVIDNTDPRYNADGDDNCALVDMRASAQIVLTDDILPLLGDTTQNHTLTFRPLTPTEFIVDSYQVLYGAELTAGYYEESIGSGPGMDAILQQVNGTWQKKPFLLYSGGNLIFSDSVNAELSFEIENSSGFSLITLMDIDGGNIDIDIQQINCGTCFNKSTTIDTKSTAPVYKAALSFAGLPLGDYQVTITNNGAKKVFIDAVQVYGPLQILGSLYDDAQTDANGSPILIYGPDNKSWTAASGALATGFLNKTYHQTSSFGGTVSFRMGDGATVTNGGFVLYYGSGNTSTKVEVCWTRLNGTPAQECTMIAVNDLNKRQTLAAPTLTGTDFAISITNKEHLRIMRIDAIQILENGFAEGIYDAAALNAGGAFGGGGWTINTALKNASGTPGSIMNFEFTGTGFSVILTDNSANQYRVCIGTGATPCTTGTVVNELITNSLAASRALTYVGLHNGSGDDSTFRVHIINEATNTRPLVVTELHVLGADATLRMDTGDRYENTTPQVQQLPFGSLTETINKLGGSSNFSEHSGLLRGSAIYFEFGGYDFTPPWGTAPGDTISSTQVGFEYVRQLSAAFGSVKVCYGQINDTATNSSNAPCVNPVPNNTPNTFQGSTAFGPGSDNAFPSAAYCENGCWVMIQNLDGRTMPVDFIRLFDVTMPLTGEGAYEQNHKNIVYDGSFDPAFTLIGATGGKVARTTTIGAAFMFKMFGTGFSLDFVNNTSADAVRVCWVRFDPIDITPDPATANDVLNNAGYAADRGCQIFDNESLVQVLTGARAITGLDQDYYAVAAEMLRDNYISKAHTLLPLRMELDRVQVFNEVTNLFDTEAVWTDASKLNVLTPGMRYETSFTNRATDRNFAYVGTWTSFSGAAYVRYSGKNYDQAKQHGAGIAFRTNNANALTLYRDLSTVHSPLLICAAPVMDVDGGGGFDWQVDLTQRTCTIVTPVSIGTQQPFSFQFNEDGSAGPHVVTINTLNQNLFNLDAIELALVPDLSNSSGTNALTAGLYEPNHPGIFYDTSYENLILNGTMEAVDGQWIDIPGSEPDSGIRSSVRRYQGIAGFYVKGGITEGVQYAEDFRLNTGQEYWITARVFVVKGSVTMRLTDDSAAAVTSTVVNQWQLLRLPYKPGSDLDTSVEFVIQSVSSGIGEFYIDDVAVEIGGLWDQVVSTLYSGGSIMRSKTHGAEAKFQFTGTGFEVGTIMELHGGEVKICYGDPADYPTNWATNARCFTHQNESQLPSYTVSRSVVGLPLDTYLVTVTDVEDGITSTSRTSSITPRLFLYAIGRVAVDYVRIFDETSPTALDAGSYNDDAKDNNGDMFLQLLPQARWKMFTGAFATLFTNQTYQSIVNNTGVATGTYAGPAARLDIDIPAGVGNVTTIVYTGPAWARSTQNLLICAQQTMGGNVTGGVTGNLIWDHIGGFNIDPAVPSDCTLVENLRTSTQFTVDGGILPALLSDANQDKVVTLTIQGLTPGDLRIDGYQVIFGDTLAPGIHDGFLPDSLLNFTGDLDSSLTCNPNVTWCVTKDPTAFGGATARTRTLNNTLNFKLRGTGFSIITKASTLGTNFRICYRLASSDTDFPDLGLENLTPDIAAGDPYCDNATTNTLATEWANRNPGRVMPLLGNQYGFSYYGLPLGDYEVEVRMAEGTGTLGATDALHIDAVVVFDDVKANPPLTSGLYDDTESSLLYEAESFWKFTISPTTLGPYNKTEHTATNAGSIMQLRIDGNAFVLYQTASTLNSSDVRVCLLITEATVHCGAYGESDDIAALQTSNFSQGLVGLKYFTPVVFYGLGDGTHPIIIENRDHGKKLSIDAIMIPD